jgi:acetolactate synthase-1/2/3 large subunit
VNGAISLLSTLRHNGVDVCFSNPGTSEMHFVAALDDVSDFRGVLCLFEGVATGAADGFGRVTGRPAATLLHLGPGLGNGIANLHNARRARTPLVNVVGDHATYHSRYDAPLDSDIVSLARPVSGWVRRSSRPDDVAADAAEAVAAAYGPPGQVATLLLPADASWGPLTSTPAAWPTAPRPGAPRVPETEVAAAAQALRAGECALLLGSSALRRPGLEHAARVAAAAGCKVFSETFPAIQDRGAGVFAPDRLIYVSEFTIQQLAGLTSIVLVGAKEPVSFFAYPNVPSRLLPEGCEVLTMGRPGDDLVEALEELGHRLHATAALEGPPAGVPETPSGELTTQSFAAAVAATMPEDLLVVDESNTGGVHFQGASQGAPPFEWMALTGGSIGFGLPCALGAAVGGGGRRVLAMEADGSMMYTSQALWSMAREGLDVTVVALSNRSYAVLNFELARVGATSEGAASRRMLDLTGPELDLSGIARGLGVPASRVTTAEDLVVALQKSYATPGPSFIEAMLPPRF